MSQAANDGDREARFGDLVRDVRACTACERMARCHALGEANGPIDARVLFVAEAPGRRGAAVTGVPLTGDESGRRFERFLALAGLDRRDVFVTNAVLCNPLDDDGRNRTPSPREIARCRPFLARTVEAVDPAAVVALGRVALESLSALTPHSADLPRNAARAVPYGHRTVVALYHPGRQSTLHRAQGAQEDDWRRLGDLVRAGHVRAERG